MTKVSFRQDRYVSKHDMSKVQDNLACTPAEISAMEDLMDEKESRKDVYSKRHAGFMRDSTQRASRPNRKRLVRQRRKLDPHALFSKITKPVEDVCNAVNTMKDLEQQFNTVKSAVAYKTSADNTLIDDVICRIQDLTALLITLSGCSTVPSFLGAIALYARTHYMQVIGERAILGLVSCVKMLLFPPEDPSARWEDLPQPPLDAHGWSETIEDVKTLLGSNGTALRDGFSLERAKKLLSNWKEGRSSDLGRNCANVVNIFVTMGFFPDLLEDPVKFRGLKLFSAQAWDIQDKPLDFIEMVCDTVLFFVEKGYHAMSTGDWSVFMHSDAEMAQLDRKFSYFVTHMPLLDSGKLDFSVDAERYGISTEAQFQVQLEDTMKTFSDLILAEKRPMIRGVYQSKYIALCKVRTALVAAQRNSCVRVKPYAVCITGGSSVAKTSADMAIQKVLLSANGFDNSKRHICTINDMDKYMSEYLSHHVGLRIDDLCNARPESYDGSPLAKIIDIINNVPKAALKADVDSKGNVMLQPKIVTVTTNVKDLKANLWSVEPSAILRRFNKFLTMTLDPAFVDPETGGFDSRKATRDLIPDYWHIDVEVIKITRTGSGRPDHYDFVKVMERARFPAVMEFLEEDSGEHFRLQNAFVSSVEDAFDIELCKHHRDPSHCQKCAYYQETVELMSARGFGPGEAPLDPHGSSLAEKLSALSFLDGDMGDAETMAHFLRDPAPPESLGDIVRAWWNERGLLDAEMNPEHIDMSVLELFRLKQAEILKTVLGASVFLASVYAGLKFFHHLRDCRESLQSQGNVVQMPAPHDEKISQWARPILTPLPVSPASRSANVKDLSALVKNAICHLTVEEDGILRASRSNIFPVWKNEWLMPAHMVRDGEFWVTVKNGEPGTVGHVNFKELVDQTAVEKIPGTDFALIRLMKGGPRKNLLKFFLEDDFSLPPGVFADTFLRLDDGRVEENCVRLLDKRVFESRAMKLLGVSYHYVRPTFFGQCMMTLVSHTKNPAIVGFHICGKTDTTFGVAGIVTQNLVRSISDVLSDKYPLACHSQGTMVLERFGIEVPLGPLKNDRHAVHFLENESGSEPLLAIYGEHDRGTARFKSSVRQSPISDSVADHLGIVREHGPPSHQCFNRHYQRDLQQISCPRGDIPPLLVMTALDSFSSKILNFLATCPIAVSMVHPMPFDVVLAGADGVTFVDRIDLSTSMGFPLNTPKRKFFCDSNREVAGITNPIDCVIPLEDAMLEAEDILASGERCYFVHRANLKDEPTKFDKDKIRVFTGCEIVCTALYRKYLLGFTRMVQRYPQVFETVVGMNASGPEWDAFVRYTCAFCQDPDFGDARIIDGDYKSFDKRIPAIITTAGYEIVLRVLDYCGYTQRQLAIVRGIMTEVCYPLYEYNGVIIEARGSLPSGIPGTVGQNGFEDVILLRIPFFKIYGVDTKLVFHEHVHAAACGDDHTAGVDDDIPEYNMQSVCNILGSYGVIYTAADKSAIDRPYDGIDEVQFLKRRFRYDDDTDTWLAPLDMSSIGKSLHNYMHRKDAISTPDQIAADALCGALRESFQHGRQEYERFRKAIPLIAREAGIDMFLPVLPTYEQARAQYFGSWTAQEDVDYSSDILDSQAHLCEELLDHIERYRLALEELGDQRRTRRRDELHARVNRVLEPVQVGFNFTRRHWVYTLIAAGTALVMIRGPLQVDPNGPLVRVLAAVFKAVDQFFAPAVCEAQLQVPMPIRSGIVKNKISYNAQSLDYSLGSGPGVPVDCYNFPFSSGVEPRIPHDIFEYGPELTRVFKNRLTTNERCLDPTQSKDQPSSQGCLRTLFKSARVRRRTPQGATQPQLPVVTEIADYGDDLLDPHVDIVAEHGVCIDTPGQNVQHQNVMFSDANPGFMHCVESEYEQVRRSVDNNDADLADFFSRPIRIQQIVWNQGLSLSAQFNPWNDYFTNPRVINRISNYHQLRAKLHVKFLLNGNAFFYGRAMVTYQPLPDVDEITLLRPGTEIDLVEASQRPRLILDASNNQGGEMVLPYVYHLNNCAIPSAQWAELGSMSVDNLSLLRHANGAASDLVIQVFAWAEDVHLSIPTSNDPGGLVPQSDEYDVGIISKPASTLSRMMGGLTKLPWIGPYAMATSIGASAIADIARVFGFSKPVIVADETRSRIANINMANTSGGDICFKLSTDPKQEVSIDPRTVGLGGTDEMSIRSIATRETYLTTFGFSPFQSADTMLWNCAVTPALWREQPNPSAPSQTEFHLTAMCFACLPFKYWRGNINFRFMIAASGFHKGRLRIVYEPTEMESLEWNTNYTAVVDIAENKDFTLSVGWGSTPAILNHNNPIENGGTTYFSSSAAIPVTLRDDRNGVLGVYVANELTVPNTTIDNDIQIHVFVSAGDNFEVYNPDASCVPFTSWYPEPLDPQSMEVDYENTAEQSKPEQTELLTTLAPTTSTSDGLTHVHIGEEIVSFRNLLKRYCYSRSLPLGPLTGTTQAYYSAAWIVANFPHYRGWAPSGAVHETSTGFPYNYTKQTLMNYLTPAFVCRRGGIRWKAHKTGNAFGDLPLVVERDAFDGTLATEYYETANYPLRGGPFSDIYAQSAAAAQRIRASSTLLQGATMTHSRTNPVLEYELPYHTNNRYSPAKRMNALVSVIDKGRDQYFHKIFTVVNNSATDGMPFMDMYVAGGEDFALMWFTGAPIMYAARNSDLPIP